MGSPRIVVDNNCVMPSRVREICYLNLWLIDNTEIINSIWRRYNVQKYKILVFL